MFCFSEQQLVTISSVRLFTLHQYQDRNQKLFIWLQSPTLVSFCCHMLVIINFFTCLVKQTAVICLFLSYKFLNLNVPAIKKK